MPPQTPSPTARLSQLHRYLQADPANPALRAEAAEVSLFLSRADEALSHADIGLRSKPADAQLTNAKARALMSLGRHVEAIPLLTNLLASQPEPNVAFNLAYAQLQAGDAAAAKATLAPFVRGEPDAPLAGLWVRSLHHLAEVDAAAAFARAHASRCAQDAGFLSAAALVYLDSGAFEAAGQASDAALAIDPACADALIARGSLALGRADSASAHADLQQAVRQRPRDGRALSALGMAKLLAGDAPGARETLREATVRMPSHIGTWHALGWACIALKSLDEARSAMQHALELDRNFGESHGAVAVVAAMQGQGDEAKAAIDRALRLDPRGLSARYAQMVLNGDTADADKFEKSARRVLSSRSLPGGITLADLIARRR